MSTLSGAHIKSLAICRRWSQSSACGEPHFSGGDERRIEILRQRVAIYRTLPNMVGYIWFSLNDYRTHCGEAGEGRLKQRIHGSTDLYGNEKPSYAVLKEVNSKQNMIYA